MGFAALVRLVAAAPGSGAETPATAPLACLERPGEPVIVPAPPDGASLELEPEPGQVLDLRGVTLAADPPRNPLVIRRADGDACVVGPTVIGNAPRDATWSEMKHNHDGDGVLFTRAVGPFTLEGARIENVEDAVGPPKAPETPREARFTVRGVYALLHPRRFRRERRGPRRRDPRHAGRRYPRLHLGAAGPRVRGGIPAGDRDGARHPSPSRLQAGRAGGRRRHAGAGRPRRRRLWRRAVAGNAVQVVGGRQEPPP